jgi:protein phosphatase
MRGVSHITAADMQDAVQHANAAVFREASLNASMSGMGTTFSALALEGDTVHIAHVGDSRVYLLRRGTIMRVTNDHTLVEEMVLKGLITPREARVHPKRHIITRALGTTPEVEIDLIQLEARPGDIFFLCSDGLSNHVEEREILRVAHGNDGWQDKLRELVGMALESGGQDNITAMFAVHEEASDR